MGPTQLDDILEFYSVVKSSCFIKVCDAAIAARGAFIMEDFGSDLMGAFWGAILVVSVASSNSFGGICKLWGVASREYQNQFLCRWWRCSIQVLSQPLQGNNSHVVVGTSVFVYPWRMVVVYCII